MLRFALCLFACTAVASAQYWEQTSGPPAPTVCLAANSKGHVFAGTQFSKVYRTTDRGTNWEPFENGIATGMDFMTIAQIKVGPNDVLYASVYGMGLMRSDDNGETWRKLDLKINNFSPASRLFFDLKRQPSGAVQIFVGYDGGPTQLLMRVSNDGGETFTEVPRSNIPKEASAIFGAFISPNSDKLFILVSYNKGLYRTTNLGGAWRRIDTDPTSGESDDTFKSMVADEKGHLYVGRNALPNSAQTPNAVVMKSTDDGESWSYLKNGWDNRDVTNNRISSISIGKNGRIWATLEKSSGPMLSTNYGESWTAIKEGFEGDDGAARAVVVSPDGAEYVAPIQGFVMRHLGLASVNENLSKLRIDAFPNPATDRLRIELGAQDAGTYEIELVDAAGRQVIPSHRAVAGAGASTSVWLSTSHIPSGMYSAVIRSDGGVRSVPVAVVH